MDLMQRYAVYYAPREGAFAFRANDLAGPRARQRPRSAAAGASRIGDPRDITAEPRRYGFHGTIRAPFRPADGVSEALIRSTVAGLAASLAPVTCAGLKVEVLQGFIALTPLGCEAALLQLGAAVVEGTNDLRAPLTEAEIARRRPDRLSPRQRELLDRWGYPHVMEEFRFHLTLTDRCWTPNPSAPRWRAISGQCCRSPSWSRTCACSAKIASGRFHLLHRYALTG